MNVLIGVSGGIAAYKSASVINALIDRNHEVKVIMTENAKEFITELTLSTLSKNPVYSDSIQFKASGHIYHIELSEWADVFCIVPATYNTIMKVIQGITDNLLTNTVVPYKGMGKRLVICPAMNKFMWENLNTVFKSRDMGDWLRKFVGPEYGKMACGVRGLGKIAKTPDIVRSIEFVSGEI